MSVDPTLTPKGEQTRTLILETALALFQEGGYEQTTMRAIAEAAGVAVGSAYYYFRSKEHLIQAFYHRMHEEHLAAARPVLEQERALEARLRGVMQARLTTIEPYHRFSGVLFKSAADPQSPLNPFSPASGPVRDEAIALFAEVLEGATEQVPDDLATELPTLLWAYHMGIILFWIHDESSGRSRTWRLAEHTVELVARLIKLGSHPLVRPLRRKVVELLADLRAG
ncbi:MAG: TetR family transcriptional regulator [Ardenticatenaceae bacterium]